MSTEEDASKLFVAGLPDSINEDVLRQLFEATGGTVRSLSLPKDRATGRPRGFGFVTLSSAEEAEAARRTLDGSLQAGRAISVRPFQAEAPRRGEAPQASGGGGGGGPASSDRTLYVGNLPYDVTQDDVQQLVSGSGERDVVRVHLPVGPDGRLRGFGFVTMGSAEAANEAIAALRSVEMGGRWLIINIAHPKGERTDRGDRPRPRPRDDSAMATSRSSEPDPAMLEAMGEPRPEGRRRAVKPEQSDSKRRKKRGSSSGGTGGDRGSARKRKRDGDWKDWDKD